VFLRSALPFFSLLPFLSLLHFPYKALPLNSIPPQNLTLPYVIKNIHPIISIRLLICCRCITGHLMVAVAAKEFSVPVVGVAGAFMLTPLFAHNQVLSSTVYYYISLLSISTVTLRHGPSFYLKYFCISFSHLTSNKTLVHFNSP